MIDLTTYALLRKQIAADAKATGDALALKLTEPSTGLAVGKYFRIAAIDDSGHAVLEAVDLPSAPVQDVQVDGTSIITDGVANVPIAGNANVGAQAKYGLVALGDVYNYGLTVVHDFSHNADVLTISTPDKASIDNRNKTNWLSVKHAPLMAANLDYAVRAAMCDGKGAAWTADEQAAARERMGIDKPYELIEEITMEEEAKIIREKEPNGTNYNFKSFLIIGETPVLSVRKYIVILINNRWAVSFSLDPNSKRYFAAKIYAEGGRMFTQSTYGASSDAISAIYARNRNSFGLHAMNAINKFETQEDTFPIGTTIKLYGVRA